MFFLEMKSLLSRPSAVRSLSVVGEDFADYGGIRAVNYTRHRVEEAAVGPATVLEELRLGANDVWRGDKYLLPAMEGDALLFARCVSRWCVSPCAVLAGRRDGCRCVCSLLGCWQ